MGGTVGSAARVGLKLQGHHVTSPSTSHADSPPLSNQQVQVASGREDQNLILEGSVLKPIPPEDMCLMLL